MDIDRFVEDCINANNDSDPQDAVKEVLARAIYTPSEALAAIGEPDRAGLRVLLRSEALTVFCATWTPQMNLMPHNHLMWANIGIYTGREDNIFWRRIKDDPEGHIEAAGADTLGPGKAVPLGKNIIHSVTNPTGIFTSAIHVYGGNFFEEHRSEWDPEDLSERDYDIEKNMRLFEEANARLG